MTEAPPRPTRPILRYPGGKWVLAPWIIAHFPPHQMYVEPFMGAASCFLRKPRSYAEVLNDQEGEVVNLFRILRDPSQAHQLATLLTLTPYARQELEEAWRASEEPLEQARRFLVRSWQSVNGGACLGDRSGWRRQSRQRGTLPAHDWGTFPHQIQAFTARLQGVIIEARTAVELFPLYDSPTTLWYIDPPYDPTSCPGFPGYRYTIEATVLHKGLAQLQGMVVLSGYRSPTYDRLYAKWRRIDHHAFAGTIHGQQRPRTESLWLNHACQQALTQLSLF